MWLRTLAGAYAGQIRDYRTDVGFAALRTGMAERVTPEPSPLQSLSVHAAKQMEAAAVIVAGSAKKHHKGKK